MRGRIAAKKWREAHPEQTKEIYARTDAQRARSLEVTCRSYVRKQIYRGKLKRGTCHCGKIGEAHHEDYTKPLEIIWLCSLHHAEHHRISCNNGLKATNLSS